MRIYIALISLQRTLRKRGISLLETPAFAAAHGFNGIEIPDRALCALNRTEVGILKNLCSVHQCGAVVDANCDLTLANDKAWRAEICHVRSMLDLAHVLGAPILRITLGGQSFSVQTLFKGSRSPSTNPGTRPAALTGVMTRVLGSASLRRAAYLWRARVSTRVPNVEAKIARAVDAIRRILPRAEQYQIKLAIENHWGISSRPEWMLRTIELVDSPWLGTCPDFGNFPAHIDRYAGLRDLAPRALHVQAKSWSFDDHGEERSIDYARCFQILRQVDYDGVVSVEYEGHGDELANCAKARDLIQKSAA